MQTTTDNYFTYRQCPATEEGTGTFDSIKGNTLVWNQLCRSNNQPTSTVNGVTFTNNLDGSWTLNGTATARTSKMVDNYAGRFVSGHKVLLGSSNFISGEYGTFPNGYVADIDRAFKIVNYAFNPVFIVQAGVTLNNVVIKPMIIDLTAMFGSTKADEIYAMETAQAGSGVAYFKSLFPLDYYEYNSGSLLNFGSPQEITWNQMVGAPRTVTDTTTGGLSVSIKDTDNSITLISGTSTQGTRIRYNDYSMIAGHKYLVSGMPSDVSVSRYYLYFSDSTGNTSRGACLTQPSIYNCAYTETERLYLHFESGITVDNVVFRPQIFDLTTMFGAGNEPSVSYFKAMFPLDYYPYSADTQQSVNASGIRTVNADETDESSTILPISQYFPNGMKSAGSIYDELTPTKAITRVGTRAYQSGDENDTSVTTDGTNTNYALTTPTETTIDEDLTYPVYVGGTEQLLPVNGSVPVTSPINVDITYRGLIPVSANVYPLGSGTVTGSGQYRYKETVTITATPSDEVFRFLRYEDENGDTLATTSTYTFKVE